VGRGKTGWEKKGRMQRHGPAKRERNFNGPNGPQRWGLHVLKEEGSLGRECGQEKRYGGRSKEKAISRVVGQEESLYAGAFEGKGELGGASGELRGSLKLWEADATFRK